MNQENFYEFVDSDPTYKLGEEKYYSVTSVDEYGNQSGKSNFTPHIRDIGPYSELSNVHAVPNPYIRESGFTGELGVERHIKFYGLTKRCTIRIFSFSGQLVATIEHDNINSFSNFWNQESRNNQDVASGVYFYVVTSPGGEQASGKLIIVK